MSTISRLLEIIGLFCRISSLYKGSFAKETYYFISCVAAAFHFRNPIHPCPQLVGS